MVGDETSAMFNEYLQSKMQKVLEALTEALLIHRPSEIEPFVLSWLQKYESDARLQTNVDNIGALKDERDKLYEEKLRLEAQLNVMGFSDKAPQDEAMKSEGTNATRMGSKETRRNTIGTSSWAMQDMRHAVSKEYSHGGRELAAGRPHSAQSINSLQLEEENERKLIQKMKEKQRRPNVRSDPVTQEQIDNFQPPFYEKSPEAKQHLWEVINNNDKLQVLFGHLTEDHVWKVIDAMFPREVQKDEHLIEQGDQGDNFYIIEFGTFDFFVRRHDDEEPGLVMECGPGHCFGELALMYNAPRAATVTATEPAMVWGLDRESFRLMLCTAENTKAHIHEGFLEGVEILQDLTKYERAQLSDMLQSDLWDAGEAIVSQGDEGGMFYILEDGEAKAYLDGKKGEIEVKHYKRPGEYFGEIALLSSGTRRKATVRASGTGCTTLSVCRADFDSVLGPIKAILAKNIDKYPQYTDFLHEEEANEKAEQEKIDKMGDRSRRAGVSADSVSEEQMKNWNPPVYDKTQEARDKIIQTIEACDKAQVLFGHLDREHLLTVVDAMFPKEAQAEEAVINQGEEGDNFYIVEEGSFDVFVQRGEATPGKVLEYGPGSTFGELALMYNCKRAATVVATSAAKLWALDRHSFRLLLCTAENTKARQYEGFLENVDILKHLTKFELAQVSDLLQSDVFSGGEDIVKQGDEGSYFYILEDGQAKAYIAGDQGEVEVKSYVTPGDYFGEIALITQGARRATVRAVNDGCSVLSVERKDFDTVLGPIKEHLATNIDKYPQYADVLNDAMLSG